MAKMKSKTLFEIAMPLALHIRDELDVYCDRIQIAGSLRRNKPEVGDIEIVAIPKPVMDLFGGFFPITSDHALNHVDWSEFGSVLANGDKYKKIMLHEGIQLDLFIVTPPAQWGVQFLIRTGPAEYSHRFVTHIPQGGMLPAFMQVKDGALWVNGKPVETPEEEDVYRIVMEPYIEPNLRA